MAAVDLNTVRSTIEGRLATELASSPAITVVFNNMSFDSTTADTFVQCQTSFGTGAYLTMGGSANSTNSIVGLVLLNIFMFLREELPKLKKALDYDFEVEHMLVDPAAEDSTEYGEVPQQKKKGTMDPFYTQYYGLLYRL